MKSSEYASVFPNIIHIKFHWKRNLTRPHQPIFYHYTTLVLKTTDDNVFEANR